MNTCSVDYSAFGFAAFCVSVAVVLITRSILEHRRAMARMKSKDD
jgi:hypothetical protein